MNTHLFDHINIDKNRTFVPDGLATDPEKACAEYNANIIKQGGIDLQLLGIGRNGHIGFNEPGTVFKKETHCVDHVSYTHLAAIVSTTTTALGTIIGSCLP